MKFELLHQEAFDDQLLSLPREHAKQVNAKIHQILAPDPRPDGITKKKLEKYKGNVCRLRCGDYRVVYCYGDGWVKLLAVRNRKDVYGDDYFGERVEVDLSQALDEPEQIETRDGRRGDGKVVPRPEQRYLSVKIDRELLDRLRVPEQYHAAFMACRTEDDLLNVNAPPAVVEPVMNVVLNPDLETVQAGPTFIIQDEDDLVRYVEGDLLGFLLKLSPEQERVVDWGMRGTGPTLVKGGPGTGKSTIALYRVQAILRALQAEGVSRPRVLFTTYTKALVHSSEQLLHRLLGNDARFVEVRTADSVVRGVFRHLGLHLDPRHDRELLPLLREAMEMGVSVARDFHGKPVLASALGLSPEYLLEEIRTVIDARELSSLPEYLAAQRTGRRVALSRRAREDVWAVYERFGQLLDQHRITTWERARRHAATLIRAGAGPEAYDGVVIDEVQDLDPSLLRLLVLLCQAPNRLFITADANQSIYGGSFRWTDVHEDLRFRGRAEMLRVNYRSTRQIGEAAQDYLRHGQIDEVASERRYVVEDGDPPAMRGAGTAEEEVYWLQRFFRQSTRKHHLTYGSCAVLVPTNKGGEAVAQRLRAAGTEAAWMTGDDLDLKKPGVKVMNLKSAKGLEFPIVALAGFVENPHFGMSFEGGPGEREERLLRERRSMFVGMTRAMRTLLVVIPAEAPNPLFEGFDAALWNLDVFGAAI